MACGMVMATQYFPKKPNSLDFLLLLAVAICADYPLMAMYITDCCRFPSMSLAWTQMCLCSSRRRYRSASSVFCSSGLCGTRPAATSRASTTSSLLSLSSFSPTIYVSDTVVGFCCCCFCVCRFMLLCLLFVYECWCDASLETIKIQFFYCNQFTFVFYSLGQ